MPYSLVITNCSKMKKFDVNQKNILKILKEHGLPIPKFNIELEETYKKILAEYILPAAEMYGGTFIHVRKLVESLKKAGFKVDFLIISARYGVIDENTPIIPYDASFSNMSDEHVITIAKKLKIFNTLINKIKDKYYDIAIITLSEKYMKTIFNPTYGWDFTKYLRTRKLIIIGNGILKNKINYPNLEYYVVKGIGERIKVLNTITQRLSGIGRRKTTLDTYLV